MAESIAACLAAGMNDHIAKPLDPEQLAAQLLVWVKHRAVDAPANPAPASAPAPAPLPAFDDLPTLRGLLTELGTLLQGNMLNAKKVAEQIDILLKDTDLSAKWWWNSSARAARVHRCRC